jgi:hypothetical protein
MFDFFVGVDFGQAQDYTAVSILHRREIVEPQNVRLAEYTPGLEVEECLVDLFDLVHLERFPLNTSYLDIVDRIARMLYAPELQGNRVLVVDQTGCGRPVTDMLKGRNLAPLIGITITGGNAVSQTPDGFNVPKRDLVSVLQLHLQSGRLGIAATLPDADLLRDEILNFKTKVRLKDGEEEYGVWREGIHDDMVLATAVALWYASRFSTDGRRPLRDLGPADNKPYDPLTWGLKWET